MNTREIEQLLERFYEGTTTPSEEQTLRDIFTAPEIPEHLKVHRPYFTFLEQASEETLADPGFEERLTKRLEATLEEPKIVRLEPQRQSFRYAMGIAAGFLLLAGLLFLFTDRSRIQEPDFDPEIAYTDVREALFMVSGNLNQGLRQTEILGKVGHAMDKLQMFNKFYQYQPIIINPDDPSGSSTNRKSL